MCIRGTAGELLPPLDHPDLTPAVAAAAARALTETG